MKVALQRRQRARDVAFKRLPPVRQHGRHGPHVDEDTARQGVIQQVVLPPADVACGRRVVKGQPAGRASTGVKRTLDRPHNGGNGVHARLLWLLQ